MPDAHEAILQFLDRDIGGTHFGSEHFTNVTDWNDVSIVFADEHPDLDAFAEDPDKELKRIQEKTGRRADIVGNVTDGRLETTGHKRLMGTLEFSEDPEIQRLIKSGKLSLSTAFRAKKKNGALDGSVKPNHVLVFEEDSENMPVDKGAVILNKEPVDGLYSFCNEGRVMSGKNKSKLQKYLEDLWDFLTELSGDEKEPVVPGFTNKVPTNPSGYELAPVSEKWSAPNLGDFTDKRWDELSATEKTGIASHYAFQTEDDSFQSLKLPHHDPTSGAVVRAGVNAAMAALGGARGADVVPAAYVEQVRSHLEAHQEEFRKADEENKQKMTDDIIKAKDAEIEDLKQKLQKATDDKAVFEQKIAAIEQEKKDADWDVLKQKLDKGLILTPEVEAETRKEMEGNPVAFMCKVLSTERKQGTPESGEKFTNKEGEPEVTPGKPVKIPGRNH